MAWQYAFKRKSVKQVFPPSLQLFVGMVIRANSTQNWVVKMMIMMRSCHLWLLLSELVVMFGAIANILNSSVYGDPANLLMNGDFELQYFSFGQFPQMDVIKDGWMDMILNWQCIYGGVQVLDAIEYAPNPIYGGHQFVHLNYKYGPGVIISCPLATPRKGATYNLSFDIADNPDGGPLYKVLRAKILVNNEISDPLIGDFNVSTPQSQRSTIAWATVWTIFVGTGESTTVQFESLTAGSFGPLIDNIFVTLMTIVDNGSFETTDSILVQTNETWFNLLTAPSDMITSWTLLSGNIKRAGSLRWQQSSDDSNYMLDMNGDDASGSIVSDAFQTRFGSEYVVLFDAAASPEPVMPVFGNLLATAKTSATGEILSYAMVAVDADGFSQNSIGWETYSFQFKATGDSAVVEFVSKILGSDGPLLDNVQCYQIIPVGNFKHVPLTYNTAMTTSRPSIWVMVFTGGFIFLTFSRCEIL